MSVIDTRRIEKDAAKAIRGMCADLDNHGILPSYGAFPIGEYTANDGGVYLFEVTMRIKEGL